MDKPKNEDTTQETVNQEPVVRVTLDTSNLADSQKPPIDPSNYKLEDFIKVLLALRSTFKSVDSVPSYVPRDFTEQFVIYSNGGTYRLYIYLVGVGWKYTALT